MTARELIDLLRAKYSPPHHALFTNVADGTGSAASRFADAMAMGIWPSRGLLLHGFEVKVSRGDWLRELKNPAKAESICRFCDHWWIVAPADVVEAAELPTTWGLLEANGRGLSVRVNAPKLEAEPITRRMLAALLRRASEQSADSVALDAARKAGYDSGFEQGKGLNSWQAKQDAKELADLRKALADFESASGVRIDRWGNDQKQVGEAVKFLLHGNPVERMKYFAEHARAIVDQAERALEQMK